MDDMKIGKGLDNDRLFQTEPFEFCSELVGLTEEEAAFFSLSMPVQELPVVREEKAVKMRKTYLIPADLVAEIESFCTVNELKRTDVVTLALQEFLAKYK